MNIFSIIPNLYWALTSCTLVVFFTQLFVFILAPLLSQKIKHKLWNKLTSKNYSDIQQLELPIYSKLSSKENVVSQTSYTREFSTYLIEIFFLALAISTLISDSLFHLLPEALSNINKEENINNHIIVGIWCFLGMISVFFIEAFVHSFDFIKYFNDLKNDSLKYLDSLEFNKIENNTGIIETTENSTPCQRKLSRKIQKDDLKSNNYFLLASNTKQSLNDEWDSTNDINDEKKYVNYLNNNDNDNCHCHGFSNLIKSEYKYDSDKTNNYIGYTNLIAVFIHNILDGIAIGASFMVISPIPGIATSICIFAHEVPNQFANLILLLRSDIKPKFAFLFNFLAALGIHLGVLLILLGVSNKFTNPLQAMAAGNFLCLSLSLIAPQLQNIIIMQNIISKRLKLVTAVSGILLGIVGMIGLSLLEHYIEV